MEKIIKIDGYEFQGKYSDESDVENLNIHLEKKFNDFYLKDFMSCRHPELFPGHIGLYSDDNLNLEVVIWEHSFLSPEGERENSWHCYKAKSPENYIGDILEYYQGNDPYFFNFIRGRIKK